MTAQKTPAKKPKVPTPKPSAAGEVALVVVTLVAVVGMGRLFDTGAYLRPFLVAALASHGISIVTRRLGWGVIRSFLASIFVGLLVITHLRYGKTTNFGLPTFRTWHEFKRDLREAGQQLNLVSAPAPALPGFLSLGATSVWLLAFVADWFAHRLRVGFEAALPSAILVVTTSLLADRSEPGLGIIWYIVVVLGFLAVHRSDRFRAPAGWVRTGPAAPSVNSLGIAAVIAAFVAVTTAVISPKLPWATSPPIVNFRHHTGDGEFTVSPLVDIRTRLTSQSKAEAFTVTSSQPSYWKLWAADKFDGVVWRSTQSFGDARSVLPNQSANGDSVFVHQAFVMGSLSSVFLPTAATPIRVTGTSGVRYSPVTDGVVLERPMSKGSQYEVDSLSNRPKVSALIASDYTAPNSNAEFFTSLPSDFPITVRDEATKITAGVRSRYEKALALERYFRDNFTYDLSAQNSGGKKAMERFLFDTQRGYCEQFSGTFAAMARSIGIPARVAVGFTQGQQDAAGVYHVSGRHAHAWPEVYFNEIGWIPFEPTPGRGAPGFESITGVAPTQVDDTPDLGTTTSQSGPTTTRAQRPATTRPLKDVNDPSNKPLTLKVTTSTSTVTKFFTAAIMAMGALLATVGLLWGARIAQRQYRRRKFRTPTQRIVLAWGELTLAFRARGLVAEPHVTRTELAAEVAKRVRHVKLDAVSRAHLVSIAGRVDSATFSPHEPTAEQVELVVADVAKSKSALHEHRRATRRWWAKITPAALFWKLPK